MRTAVSLVRSPPPPISALLLAIPPFCGRANVAGVHCSASGAGSLRISSDSIVLKDFPLVFIRGPFVAEVGSAATVETSVSGNVVGLRQGKILATAFHPELTDDTRIHELFLSL